MESTCFLISSTSKSLKSCSRLGASAGKVCAGALFPASLCAGDCRADSDNAENKKMASKIEVVRIQKLLFVILQDCRFRPAISFARPKPSRTRGSRAFSDMQAWWPSWQELSAPIAWLLRVCLGPPETRHSCIASRKGWRSQEPWQTTGQHDPHVRTWPKRGPRARQRAGNRN